MARRRIEGGIPTLFATLPAAFAVQARVGEPLDADAVTEFNGALGGVVSDGDDDAYTLVPADERGLGVQGPVVLLRVQIRVADTGALELDETLARREVFLRRDRVRGLNSERAARGRNDGSLLCFGNNKVGHGGWW